MKTSQAKRIYESEWVPSPQVTDHTGHIISSRDDFFAPPPREIGEVITAQSTLSIDEQPHTVTLARFLMSLAAITPVITVWLTWVVLVGTHAAFYGNFCAGELLLACAAFLFVWTSKRPVYECSYVGELGAARYECVYDRTNIVKQEVFNYCDAVDVKSSIKSIDLNSRDSRESYDFRFIDDTGSVAYRIKGAYFSTRGLCDLGEPVHYGCAVEHAWSMAYMPYAVDRLNCGETVDFAYGWGKTVKIGTSYVECEGRRIPESRIQDISCDNHWVTITVFSSEKPGEKETIKLRWSRLTNAFLFMMLTSVAIVPANTPFTRTDYQETFSLN